MARPNKQGLDYFPLNVDFFEDEKIEAISGEFGLKGELATVKLLCAVYHNGYFVVWNSLLKMKLLKRLPGVSPELLDQIVNRLVAWGFFDETLYNSDKVLTSNGIQKRYIEATHRRKDTPPMVYVCNNGVNVDINPAPSAVIVDINAQSKVKESKLNKSKVFVPPSIDEVIEYFTTNGYRKEIAARAFAHYDVADWHDSNGKKVKNWKQKVGTNWFKEEHKIQQAQQRRFVQ